MSNGLPKEALKQTAVAKIRSLRCRTSDRLATKDTNAREKVAQSDGRTAVTSEDVVLDTALVTGASEERTVPVAEETPKTPLSLHQTTIGTVENLNRVAEKSIERRNEVAGKRRRNQRKRKRVTTTTRQVRVQVPVENRTRQRTKIQAIQAEDQTTRKCGGQKQTISGRINSSSRDQSTSTRRKEKVQRSATWCGSSAVPTRQS